MEGKLLTPVQNCQFQTSCPTYNIYNIITAKLQDSILRDLVYTLFHASINQPECFEFDQWYDSLE